MENWSNIMLAVLLINLAATPNTPNPKKYYVRDFFVTLFGMAVWVWVNWKAG